MQPNIWHFTYFSKLTTVSTDGDDVCMRAAG
jgi:hypothetical protein